MQVLYSLYSAISQAFLYAPLAVGVGYSYVFLRKTDLSPEGTFVLGACIFAKTILITENYYFALCAGMLAGALGGAIVFCLQKNRRMNPILASLMLIYILYSVNLIFLGRPNISIGNACIPLFGKEFVDYESQRMIGSIINGIILCALTFLLSGRKGLLLRAVGSNSALMNRLGYKSDSIAMLGLMLSNALAALAGANTTIIIGYADINMGLGNAFIAITTCLVGRSIAPFKRETYWGMLLQCVLGLTLYFFILSKLIFFNITPTYFKLTMGIVLIVILFASKKRCKK
ncbi:MAG: hypothetical protein OXC30_00910 [Alphaproteobacteria bacterium]|nr:hypothetical protein [Alphaproteobacteria bacterium]